MSEKFDFSKIEDCERFKKLPKEEQGRISDKAQGEALEMDEKLKDTFGMAPEEWKDFFIAFGNIRKEVLGKIFSLDEEMQKLYVKKIQNKEKELFSSVKDPWRYLSYHKSIASSTGPISAPMLDFEGESSLFKFYQELLKELNDMEDNKKIKIILDKIKEKFKKVDTTELFLQLNRLTKAFKGLNNVKGKKILDLGCGSISGTFETDQFNELDRKRGKEPSKSFEPWLCRALVELEARPVGIDIGNLEGEKFEHYRVDLSALGALDFLPDKSFDGINMRLFFSSPHLEKMTTKKEREDIKEELEKQIKRLLKDDGKIIEFNTQINS